MVLTTTDFHWLVQRANLAPSIHNAQPARWRLVENRIEVAADLSVALPQADPDGHGIAMSVGAAVEATVLALSELGAGAQVVDHWPDDDRHSWGGHRLAARITVTEGIRDPLAACLPDRGTWRGAFHTTPPDLFGWTRADTRLIFDAPRKAWIARLNDKASLKIMAHRPFRSELLSWMRLVDHHPRRGLDGMDIAALRMDAHAAKSVRLAFGPLWPFLHAVGRTETLLSEAAVTQSTPIIAAFHRPKAEDPIATGRAYLRMWLEATQLGMCGWPMAALTDDLATRQEIEAQMGIPSDQTLVQVLRFGSPTGDMPTKARRPISELTPS